MKKVGDYIEDIIEVMNNAMEFTRDMEYDERIWEVIKKNIPRLEPIEKK